MRHSADTCSPLYTRSSTCSPPPSHLAATLPFFLSTFSSPRHPAAPFIFPLFYFFYQLNTSLFSTPVLYFTLRLISFPSFSSFFSSLSLLILQRPFPSPRSLLLSLHIAIFNSYSLLNIFPRLFPFFLFIFSSPLLLSLLLFLQHPFPSSRSLLLSLHVAIFNSYSLFHLFPSFSSLHDHLRFPSPILLPIHNPFFFPPVLCSDLFSF